LDAKEPTELDLQLEDPASGQSAILVDRLESEQERHRYQAEDHDLAEQRQAQQEGKPAAFAERPLDADARQQGNSAARDSDVERQARACRDAYRKPPGGPAREKC